MADRPRDDTWWIASDGKWYPPSLQPDSSVAQRDIRASTVNESAPTAVPGVLTRVLTAALVATSAVFGVASIFGLLYWESLRSGSEPTSPGTSAEDTFLGWSSFALLAMVLTGVIVLTWTFQTSRAFDARGSAGRRWRGAWTIGGWFIPFASFIIPKFVFNELEKISVVAYTGEDIGERWKEGTRSSVGDLWWLTWVAGLFMYQGAEVFLADAAVEADVVAMATLASAAAHAVLAGAGVALVFVLRRIEAASRT